MSEYIEIIIRLPANNQSYKEFAETIARVLGQSTQVQTRPSNTSKTLTPEQETQLNSKRSKIKELQTLLEIAKARGQKSVVAETESEIKKLEREIAALI